MNQHQIRLFYEPQPTPNDRFVTKAEHAVAIARAWGREAQALDIPGLLPPTPAEAMRSLIALALSRDIFVGEAAVAFWAVTEAVSGALASLLEHDEVDGEADGAVLHDQFEALLRLCSAIDEALDLATAIRARDLLLGRVD